MKKLIILMALLLPTLPALANEPAEASAPHEQVADDFGRQMARMVLDLVDHALVEMRKGMLGETSAAKGKCNCKCPAEGKHI